MTNNGPLLIMSITSFFFLEEALLFSCIEIDEHAGYFLDPLPPT